MCCVFRAGARGMSNARARAHTYIHTHLRSYFKKKNRHTHFRRILTQTPQTHVNTHTHPNARPHARARTHTDTGRRTTCEWSSACGGSVSVMCTKLCCEHLAASMDLSRMCGGGGLQDSKYAVFEHYPTLKILEQQRATGGRRPTGRREGCSDNVSVSGM